jgi:hypothetical protein
MRRKLVLGVGLAVLAGGTAVGQFAVDRVPPVGVPAGAPTTAAPLPGGLQPVVPPATPAPVTPTGGYAPPVGGLQPASYATGPANSGMSVAPAAGLSGIPASVEIPTALPKDHPWAIKPEHGPYFILVKSYVRPAKGSKAAEKDPGLTALELAEGLAREVRETHRVQAFLYEYISEERKAEERAKLAARQRAAAYAAQIDSFRQKAQLQGMEFLTPDNTIHIMSHSHRDQIGVLVGGFQTEADAAKGLAVLKKWPAPKNEALMDGSAIVKPGPDGKTPVIEKTRLNPYCNAFVVPNPSVQRNEQAAARGVDPFLVRLNERNPYSLLKATKGWTLGVKSFSSPVEIGNKDSDTSLMRKMGFAKGADVLAAGAEQAEQMAKAIRQMRGPGSAGQPGPLLNLEAFVLHTRNASLVTVGQFDGPDDPALHATRRLLAGIKLGASEDPHGMRPVTNSPAVFGNLVPMPIPKP